MKQSTYLGLCCDLETKFNEQLTNVSIRNQVLHANTALIAKKKIADVSTGEVQFIKIPLTSALTRMGNILVIVGTLTGQEIDCYVAPSWTIDMLKA